MLKKVFLVVFFVGFWSCQTYKPLNQLIQTNQTVTQIRHKLLPDKRDHIFRLQMVELNKKITLKGATDFPELKQKIIQSLSQKGYKVIDSLKLLPDEKFKNRIGITRLSVANLRAQPKHSAELVTQTLMGMPLKIYEVQNGFYHVKTPEGYYAWVDAAGIEIVSRQKFKQWLTKPKIIITAQCGKICKKPYADAVPVSDYVLNDVFALKQMQDDYALVEYPDGRNGFLKKGTFLTLKQFEENNKKADADDLINNAKQYLGIPYLWGGTSTKGLDCSGFTKNVYAQLGYLLPRDASQQVKIGKTIQITADFSQLKPGDLLFFGHQKNGKDKITHVAIHMGNGRIIHATGEVKIESLNQNDKDYNPDRYKTLLQARRILGKVKPVYTKYYTLDCPMLHP